MSTAPREVFDKALKKRQREWAVKISEGDRYDYLREAVAERLVDRLDDILRDFEVAVDIGCHKGHICDVMLKQNALSTGRGIGGIKHLVQSDISDFSSHFRSKSFPKDSMFSTEFVLQDEETSQWKPDSYNLVMSSMWLHWVNYIPGLLKNVCASLKPDGAFIGTMLGGSTLEEFRHSFYLAELERTGGVSPHMSPLARPSDAAALLQGAGFALPTVDVDTITVRTVYPLSSV
jgi:NADH dehydrogenase [ubiquinone] 1 alpha subcomplex assembly factor 5